MMDILNKMKVAAANIWDGLKNGLIRIGLKIRITFWYILKVIFKVPYRVFQRRCIAACDAYVKRYPNERNDISMRYW